MTKHDNAMLTRIPAPRHRQMYPGELMVTLGSASEDGEKTWKPGGFSVALQYASNYHERTRDAARAGEWRLLTKEGQPVILCNDNPGMIDLADLNTFTGLPLAAELAAIMEKMLAGFDPAGQVARQTVRFRDLAKFNDLMVGIAWQHLNPGVPRTVTLTKLLAGLDDDAAAQAAWYIEHDPDTSNGETPEAYKQEYAGFMSLADEYRRVTGAQLAVTGNGGSR